MISVIVCTVDQIKAKSAESHYAKLLARTDYEFIPIRNPISMAVGYNEGIDKSKGDVLIFSHDDIEFLQEDFVGTLERHLQLSDVMGVAGTRTLINANWISAGQGQLFGQVAHPHGAGFGVCCYGTESAHASGCMAVDGCWMCSKRAVAEDIRYDATFGGFHCYDMDFSLRAHRKGYHVGVASDLFPIHYSGGTYDASWREACRSFEEKHDGSFAKGYHRTAARPFTSRLAMDKVEVLKIMQENLRT